MNKATDFWSRRRDAVSKEAALRDAETDAQAVAQEQAAFAELTEAEVLEQLNLPDPDILEPGDDFSAFMAKAVPEAIRHRALRTLWRSNPVLANVDMLVDYGEDFTDSAMVVEKMQTTYQVGKGMKAHVDEMIRQAAEKEAVAQDDAVPDDIEDDALATVEVDEPVEAPAPPDQTPDVAKAKDVIIAPRRMTFQTEETA